jgi:hypothetical protein
MQGGGSSLGKNGRVELWLRPNTASGAGKALASGGLRRQPTGAAAVKAIDSRVILNAQTRIFKEAARGMGAWQLVQVFLLYSKMGCLLVFVEAVFWEMTSTVVNNKQTVDAREIHDRSALAQLVWLAGPAVAVSSREEESELRGKCCRV